MDPWQHHRDPNQGPMPPGPLQYYPQPGYQQYPGYQQPYPYPSPYPLPPRASAGTAVAAIVLGLLIGIFQVFVCIGYMVVASEVAENPVRAWIPGFLIFEGVARFFAAAALVVGAVVMIRRHPAGRLLMAGGAIAVLVLQVLDFGVRASIVSTTDVNPVSSLSSLILPIILVVLTSLNATSRWLGQGQRRFI